MNWIFIHGLGQKPSSWNKVKDHLSADRKISCPDLFSFPDNGEAVYGRLYQAFEKYCADTGEAVNLCGISLGAVLALNYAVDHPEKVKSLILIAPQYRMPRLLLKLQNLIFHLLPENLFRASGIDKKTMIRLTNSMMSLDFRSGLCEISVPVLILCGQKDKANLKAAERLADLVPGAELRRIPNAGHEVNQEAPEEMAACIEEFSRRIASPVTE